ncbi:MAG TPA: membrane protein insertase YidC [Acidobacteriaceae bacterium]|nr:membrane protein insertase YidC [Acidobacteriaceae bacterium]
MAEYQNPNQQGGQDTRSLLVFTLVFVLVLLGMEYFRPKKAPVPAAPSAQTATQSTAPMQEAPSASAKNTPAVPSEAAASESTTTIENELYRIQFSNRGGQVTSWVLKKYTDEQGKPLDLVNQQAAKEFGYPLSVYTYDPGLRSRLQQALYVPSATGTITAPGALNFVYSDGGLVVHKSFHFDNSYVIHADVTVTENGVPVEAMLAWPSGFGDQQTGTEYALGKLDSSRNGKADSVAFKKVVGDNTLQGPFDWAGVSDLYFAAIFLPDAPNQSALVSLSHSIQIPKESKPVTVLGAAMGTTSGTTSVRIFAGPKGLEILRNIHAMGPDGKPTGPDLEPIVHYGIWSILAKPLFWALRWIHDHVVSNWGWAILLITVIITVAMLPTRITMMKSSIKMQRIQPQLNSIKEKYKKYKFDDPRKQDMNKEMTALYKEEGVNMFGGCLPMLIQFPLIFAFYSMLENAIELRHAHWFWLHDLSAPDQLHILPIVMVVSQFLVQFYTPTPGMDAAQQKMMAFTMPLFSGFICWHYASGLALYWACSNLISIVQQMVMNRTKLGRELREIQAKRAAKKHGRPALAVRR